MRVLVFGASGQIGEFLLRRLRARGDTVWAVSRQPRADGDGVHWLTAALPQGPDQVPEVDAIFSVGPLSAWVQWLEHARLPGSPRLLAMSSMSLLSKRASSDPHEQATVAALAAAEAGLKRVADAQQLTWTLLRSTLIYGCGRDHSLTPIARRAMRWRLFPLPPGQGLRQPVHADDLAAALIAAGDCPAADGLTLELGGGERLTAADMFARVRRALPVWTLPLPLPRMALRVLARTQPARAAMIARLDTDLVADNDAACTLLGVRPRKFEPRW